MLSDFVLPFIGVILLYALFYSMTASKKNCSWVGSFFYLIFIREAGSAINQQFTFLFLFIGLWLIWKIYISDFNKKRSNIIFGSVLYLVSCFIFILIFGRR